MPCKDPNMAAKGCCGHVSEYALYGVSEIHEGKGQKYPQEISFCPRYHGERGKKRPQNFLK